MTIPYQSRRYHVVAINERTGKEVVMTRPDEPLSHPQACTFKSKMTAYPWIRTELREVQS